MRRSIWIEGLAVMSALTLLVAACGSAEVDEGLDATGAEPATEADDRPAVGAEDDEAAAPAEPEKVTAYVVAYHWGWAVFDETGNELDVLEVTVGTEIELVAVNDHASHAIGALPEPVGQTIRSVSWHERAHHDVEMGRIQDPELEDGIPLDDALALAHDGHHHVGPTPDHGLLVTGIGVEVFLDAHADQPERLSFMVEHEGRHEFRCTQDCGVGHEQQRWEMLVVTA